MATKTYNEKLNSPSDLPKIRDLSKNPEAVQKMGGAKMLIASPLQYNEIMSKIPNGKIITTERIRSHLAAKSGADIACPFTCGIFTNVCANASEERDDNKIPWWRTLKSKGELNEKYPGGIGGQKLLLEAEGHTVIQKGKRYFAENYEENLFDLD